MCKACEDEAERHLVAMFRVTALREADLDEAEQHVRALLAEADAMDGDWSKAYYEVVDDEPDTEPYLIRTQAEIDKYPPFPFADLSWADAAALEESWGGWWTKVRELFCDSSGFGSPREPALTVEQLKAELRPGFGYAITAEEPPQVYVTEYKRSGDNDDWDDDE